MLAVDNKKVFGALLTDLSKAFDCICHDLLIAKLNVYGLSLPALKLVHNYLQNRKQRTKNGTAYSLWEEIFSGVPQGLILGPLLFSKCHLLLSTTDAFNFEISETVIRNSNSKKLLGVTFDNKLKFEKHIIAICQRANRKLNALASLTPYMELGKRRIIMNTFFNSQFHYCLVIWM